jgi:hypothetical protein
MTPRYDHQRRESDWPPSAILYSCYAQCSKTRRFPVPGGWTVTRNDVAPIHTFAASEDGWLVNSHVIEFSSQLFVIDAQYTLPNGGEVARYARDLQKPMTRLIVTHYHHRPYPRRRGHRRPSLRAGERR